eukprot:SAG31_NODE_840_length_11596_cov_3.056623_5_plen_81_part_00
MVQRKHTCVAYTTATGSKTHMCVFELGKRQLKRELFDAHSWNLEQILHTQFKEIDWLQTAVTAIAQHGDNLRTMASVVLR